MALIALGLPALACHSDFLGKWLRLPAPKKIKHARQMPASGGIRDAASGRALLEKHQPEWVLLGNSMLHSRVEPTFLQQLAGTRVYKLSISTTKSAMWYLMLKQMVVESKVKPKCVSVFFTNRDLTSPYLRLMYNNELIERLNGREEPEWDVVMGRFEATLKGPVATVTGEVSDWLDELYPASKLHEWARAKVQKTAFNLTSFGGPDDYQVRRDELNAIVSLDHQRPGKAGQPKRDPAEEARLEQAMKLEREEPLKFDASPHASFLPHMIALAKAHGITLHFHRIKENPVPSAAAGHYEQTLPAYLAELQAYLQSQGCLYSDETPLSGITAGMYVDRVHLRSDAPTQQTYMQHFWEHVQPVLADSLQLPSAKPAP